MTDRDEIRTHVSFVSTYVPRRCGIATFTHDLVRSLCEHQGNADDLSACVDIVALNNTQEGYPYGPEVHFEIRDQHKADYREAADFLNVSPVDVVSIQHEFGIFGGTWGGHLITLLENLKKPVVTTLHTVLREPFDDEMRRVFEAVCERSTLLVVMAHKAREILTEVYGVPEDKIVYIPHGAPDIPFLDPSFYKDQFQLEGRRVILTFGLISPNKGIEYAIRAMRRVVDEHPDVAYVVLGATHPEIKRRFGEQYRMSLQRLVDELGLQEHVIFHNRYVTFEQLTHFLIASDLYVTPYLSREQIVSGTLTYAIATGKAIVSTPYFYAEETLADERGVLVPFQDADALAEALIDLLSDENKRNRLRKNAYQYGRKMIWPEVARQYASVFARAVEEYGRLTVRHAIRKKVLPQTALPEVKLDYLKVLSDDTGILQHATYTVPNRVHGYCTDDNARAVMVAAAHWDLFRNEEILPLLYRYLAFLHHAFNPENGRFRNFMSFDHRWLEDAGSEDSHGRALQALGYVIAHPPTDSILAFATRLFGEALPAVHSLKAPRALAFSILGAADKLKRFGGAREARQVVEVLSDKLAELLAENATADWYWFEDVLTYDNARLPQALIAAGRVLGSENLIEAGLRSLEWLVGVETDPSTGYVSVVGNDGWYRKGQERAQFDQQPVEVASLADAAHEAYEATGDRKWLDLVRAAFNWFLGDNDIREPVYDFSTGGCRDALESSGVNQNQGAESTLAWLSVLHRMYAVVQEQTLQRELEATGVK